MVDQSEKQKHYDTIYELEVSAQSCPLCKLLLKSLPHLHSYTPDERRSIMIQANYGGLKVAFPSREHQSVDRLSERCGELPVSIAHGESLFPLVTQRRFH